MTNTDAPGPDALIRAAMDAAADTCFNPKWKPKTSTDWVQARTAGVIRALANDPDFIARIIKAAEGRE